MTRCVHVGRCFVLCMQCFNCKAIAELFNACVVMLVYSITCDAGATGSDRRQGESRVMATFQTGQASANQPPWPAVDEELLCLERAITQGWGQW